MSDGNPHANNDLISKFPCPSQMKHIQYEKANNKINNLTDYLQENNHCDEQTSKEIKRQIKLIVSDLYKSLDTPDFIDQTDDEMISGIQKEAKYYIPADVIKPAYVYNMIIKILGVLESKDVNTARGAAFAQKMLVALLPIIDSMQTEKNVDPEKIKEIVLDCFDNDDLFIPSNAKIEKLGYSIKGIKAETPFFVMQKFEKGDCEARYIGDNSRPCSNKTENGKICCCEHQPLSQEEKRIINENKSGTFSSNESEIAQSESSSNNSNNSENFGSDKCKYINGNGKEQCKNFAYVCGFCSKCHKKHGDDSSILKSNDYCTIIIASGFNKGRVCGQKSCEKGFHMCTTHYEKANEGNVEKCPHTNKDGVVCNAKIKNPSNKACGKHLNSTSYVHCEPEPERKKSEALLEWEQEQAKRANAPVKYCEMMCGNGNPCTNKGPYIIPIEKPKETKDEKETHEDHEDSWKSYEDSYEDETETKSVTGKSACGKHYDLYYKNQNKPKIHRCFAKYKTTGEQCRNKNVPECDLYCTRHESYDPDDQCGAFNLKTENRCLKDCENGKDFCVEHKNYTSDPIKENYEVDIIRGLIRQQEFYNFNNQYTVVCVDPPKKVLKLKIVEDKPSNQKPIKSMIEGEGYGLDCFVSDSEEESACTEESELEIILPEVVTPKRFIIPEEFELVNKATGWTEEQIKIMKNKLIYKRVLGPKKKFDLEKSLFETRKNLEQYFVNAINKANGKYEGCKTQLENVIRATHSDLSASVENVIGLFCPQRFSERKKLIDNCKDSLKDLRNLEFLHKKKIENLPVPVTKKQLVKMDTEKYVDAFNDVINTVKKEIKEDIKYIKEFEQFLSGPPKKAKYDREEKRKEFNQKYRDYFEKYIVRFAKVSLHKENCKGRMFGFANYFIDLLNKKPLDYTRFRDVYGGQIRNEDGERSFYCDVFSIITKIIENYKNNKDDKNKIMDYLDVDISTNLSSSEHQTEFSQELRECQRTGKTKPSAKSMLEVGKIERFAVKDGFYDYDDWKYTEETMQEFYRGIPGFHGNLLEVNARENNYPNYGFSKTQAPQIARRIDQYGITLREEIDDEFKPSYENNVEEILGMNI